MLYVPVAQGTEQQPPTLRGGGSNPLRHVISALPSGGDYFAWFNRKYAEPHRINSVRFCFFNNKKIPP